MIDLMRLMSIFGNLGQQGQEYNSPMDFRTPPFVPQQTFGGGFQSAPPINPYAQPQQQPFQPTMTMQDKFMELIQGFPQRDTNPSGWRKIGALLTGLGGENAGEAMSLSNTALNLPHINRVQDWVTQTKPTMEAAENERLYNQYEQTRILNQQKADELEAYRRDQLRRQEERDKVLADQGNERLRQGDQRLHIQQQAQTLREWKAANPGWEFVNDTSTGKVVAINKADPSQVRQTGVNHGDLSDEQKFVLGLDKDKELATFREGLTRDTIRLRHELTQEDIRLRDELIRTRPRGSAGGTSELEVTRALDNSLRQMLIDNPDWDRYIQNGVIKRGTPVEIADEIRNYLKTPREPIVAPRGIQGTSGTTFRGQKIGGEQGEPPPPQQRPANRPAPPDTLRVRSDGKVFVWDNETGQYGYVLRDAVTKAKTADGKMRFEVIR